MENSWPKHSPNVLEQRGCSTVLAQSSAESFVSFQPPRYFHGTWGWWAGLTFICLPGLQLCLSGACWATCPLTWPLQLAQRPGGLSPPKRARGANGGQTRGVCCCVQACCRGAKEGSRWKAVSNCSPPRRWHLCRAQNGSFGASLFCLRFTTSDVVLERSLCFQNPTLWMIILRTVGFFSGHAPLRNEQNHSSWRHFLPKPLVFLMGKECKPFAWIDRVFKWSQISPLVMS